MTTECYYGTCRFHGTHGGEEGPFCFEEECRATEHELVLHGRIRELTYPNVACPGMSTEFNVNDIDTYFNVVHDIKLALNLIPKPTKQEAMANPTMWGIYKDLNELTTKLQHLEIDLISLRNTTR